MHITIPVLLNVNINQMPGDDSKTFVGHKHFFSIISKIQNSYRTPTECWQKTSDFPKDKKLPKYLGRATEKRKNETKE